MLLHALPELVTFSISRELPAAYDWALVVGSEINDAGRNAIFVGADGWEVSFSPDQPLAAAGRKNPVERTPPHASASPRYGSDFSFRIATCSTRQSFVL
jgi:hypothetical protein